MPDKAKKCPLLRGKCIEHGCHFWIQLYGTNPQTGQLVQEYNCSFAWLPLLLIEGVQKTNQLGAAIESFRNEMVRLNQIGMERDLLPKKGPGTNGSGDDPDPHH